MLGPAQRFLNAELERINSELERMGLGYNAFSWDGSVDAQVTILYEEYRRRYEIIHDLLPDSVTASAALNAVEQKLADAQMILDELIAVQHDDILDPMAENLVIDVHYLTGLARRLKKSLKESAVTYALANVDRL